MSEERKYQEALRARYGDEYSADAEADFLDRFVDDTGAEIGVFKDAEAKLSEVLAGNPEFAAMVLDVSEGASPAVAFIKAFGAEALEAIEGEDDYEANLTARGERAKKKEEYDKLIEDVSLNEEASIAAIDAYAAEHGLDAEEILGTVSEFFENALHKRVSPEMLEMILKIKNYDADVVAAKEAGAVEGRNAQIDAKKAKTVKTETGDGMPGGRSARGVTSSDSTKSRMLDAVKGIGKK